MILCTSTIIDMMLSVAGISAFIPGPVSAKQCNGRCKAFTFHGDWTTVALCLHLPSTLSARFTCPVTVGCFLRCVDLCPSVCYSIVVISGGMSHLPGGSEFLKSLIATCMEEGNIIAMPYTRNKVLHKRSRSIHNDVFQIVRTFIGHRLYSCHSCWYMQLTIFKFTVIQFYL